MRTSERSHKWINFTFDFEQLASEVWLLLGQAQAQCEQISRVPLTPAVKEELLQVWLIKGAQATTAIEGNTLTEEEIRKHLDGQLELSQSTEYLAQEVDNVIFACNKIGSTVLSNNFEGIQVEDIEQYNADVLRKLPEEDMGVSGRLRTLGENVRVGSSGYEGAPAEDLRFLMHKLCDWLNTEFQPPSQDKRIAYGILRSIVSHVYLAWIHPFFDGNGRTARLMELRFMLEAGVPKPSAQLLSNHYNRTRTRYYQFLALSSKMDNRNGIYTFVKYALEGLVDGLNTQLNEIGQQILGVHWDHYIYQMFKKERNNDTSARRMQLIQDLSSAGRPVPVPEIQHLTPYLAEAYASKKRKRKTIQQDLNHLEKMHLVDKSPEGYLPNFAILQAFLPPSLPDHTTD